MKQRRANCTTNIDAITVEIYRRAVRLYTSTIHPWIECLSEATSSIQIELDFWVITPEAMPSQDNDNSFAAPEGALIAA